MIQVAAELAEARQQLLAVGVHVSAAVVVQRERNVAQLGQPVGSGPLEPVQAVALMRDQHPRPLPGPVGQGKATTHGHPVHAVLDVPSGHHPRRPFSPHRNAREPKHPAAPWFAPRATHHTRSFIDQLDLGSTASRRRRGAGNASRSDA